MTLTEEESALTHQATAHLALLMGKCHTRGDDRSGVMATLATLSAVLAGVQILPGPDVIPNELFCTLRYIEGLLDGSNARMEQMWPKERV